MRDSQTTGNPRGLSFLHLFCLTYWQGEELHSASRERTNEFTCRDFEFGPNKWGDVRRRSITAYCSRAAWMRDGVLPTDRSLHSNGWSRKCTRRMNRVAGLPADQVEDIKRRPMANSSDPVKGFDSVGQFKACPLHEV